MSKPLHCIHFALFAASLLTLAGCGGPQGDAGGASGPSDDGPFGPPSNSPLLTPLAGTWSLDFEKTLDAQKAAGATDEQISRLRKFYTDNPQFGRMHPDMTIKGSEAISVGSPASEYRFFAMHQHDGKLCGKAWHHEDRFDPGDMSKCYVRMEVREGNLIMEIKMKDGLPDLNDPDLHSLPPAEGGSAASCDADNPAGADWSEWATYVFTRKQ